MGARAHMSPRLMQILPEHLAFGYIGRPERASPGEGYPAAHVAEQSRIVQHRARPLDVRSRCTREDAGRALAEARGDLPARAGAMSGLQARQQLGPAGLHLDRAAHRASPPSMSPAWADGRAPAQNSSSWLSGASAAPGA